MIRCTFCHKVRKGISALSSLCFLFSFVRGTLYSAELVAQPCT
nr:MAG TPA: hypothetical protein [Caudoviricetes sp.]